jgi:cystathionine beta-lyase/cystathionine gamma-synthase
MKGKPLITPVHLTATYQFDSSNDLIDVVQTHQGYIYSRWDNPSVVAAEQALAALEGYDRALGFSSGMAAITTALLAFTKSGARVVATRETYGGTFEFLDHILPEFGVQTTFVNCWDTAGLLAEIKKGLSVLYLESPTNPLLRVVDIQPLAQAAKAQGALVLLDSTFASPVNQRPIDLGVDLVIHSATKYLGGHHDLTAGFVCCNQPHAGQLWTFRKILGGVMDPMSAFLISRGLKTLDLRVRRQNQVAQQVAEFLAGHPKVREVHYPGLPGHPDHAIAQKQMSGFGGMLSFELDTDFDHTKHFMDSLEVIVLATSLGGVTSLATQPITNTHVGLSPEDRAKAGVSESLVRLSVGIEDPAHLIADLSQALAQV